MQIPRDQILEFLRNQGQHDRAAQAEQNLPDQVDHEQHADLLAQHGINPQDLLAKFGGRTGL